MTNTPSEGPATTGTRALTPDETLIATRVETLVAQRLAAQARADELRRRSLAGRARRVAPYAAVAAVGAATEPGQQVLSAAGDAAVTAGQGIADAGVAVGDAAVSAGEAVGDAAVTAGQAVGDAAVTAGEAVGHAAEAVGREAAHIGQEIGQGATDAYNASVHGVEQAAGAVADTATSAWDSTVQGVQGAASAVSGWAVETWHSASDAVTTAAHAVGSWAAQYGDQIAAHPGNAAVTAGLGAAAVVAATPALRQGVGNAIKAVSRWARDAPGEIAQKARSLAVGAMLTYNNLRGIDSNRGESAKATHQAVAEANQITGGDRPLPSVAEVREALAAPGSDPALAPAGGKQPEAAVQTGQGTQGQGAAERTGAAVDPKTKNGPAQGL
ncbi:hypothetical protein GCM10009630_29470 [Kribbella jejuensis]|uniref:Uncharacterized protein n=1 Tax=Kribbella jejuensis TaxID=236068 RepID=A0A542EQ45_9ACTN|nr:hypothetical protein [Kribbella jejuensis]TQJ17449.1 hypothetical protein FB475_1567 [Kribbella jejuensis]